MKVELLTPTMQSLQSTILREIGDRYAVASRLQILQLLAIVMRARELKKLAEFLKKKKFYILIATQLSGLPPRSAVVKSARKTVA